MSVRDKEGERARKEKMENEVEKKIAAYLTVLGTLS
jgi:hypothetical protein